jgi:hypothetical protein
MNTKQIVAMVVVAAAVGEIAAVRVNGKEVKRVTW